MTEHSPNLKASLDYQSHGWSVIALHGITGGICDCRNTACKSPGKHPIGSWKHRQEVAATPPELIELFTRHPNANVGIVTGAISGIVVLDVDDPSIFVTEPQIAEMANAFRGPVVITGRVGGGFHLYFRHPGFPTGNFAKRLRGLDGRGDGGYVVAPPSMHANGNVYAFDGNLGVHCALPELPEELRTMFEGGGERGKQSKGAKALADEAMRVKLSAEGTRNDTLNVAAFNLGQLCGDGVVNRSDVECELLCAAIDAGLTANEAEKTIASGINAGLTLPRSQRQPTKDGGQDQAVEGFNPLDMSIVNGARIEPPGFPLGTLGPKWSGWCEIAADNAGVPVDYVATPLLAVASCLLGNAVRVSPSKGWAEASHLWMTTVGDPSAGKTPGFGPVLKLLEPLERDLRNDYKKKHREWKEASIVAGIAVKSWKKECEAALNDKKPAPTRPIEAQIPPAPECAQIKVNDATREKLALISRENDKGLLFFRDELAGWMNDFSRYGADGFRQDWLEAYNGNSRSIERVKYPEPVIIQHWSIGVLGGFQPERLAECLIKQTDDGLSARFLYSWPDPLPFQRPRERDLPDFATVAFHKLHKLPLSCDEAGNSWPSVKPLSADASELFQLWRERHYHDVPIGALLKGHYGKMPGMALRLAVVIEYLRWSADDIEGEPVGMSFGDTISEISAVSIEAAITLIEEYFKPMAHRVFRDAEIPEGDRLATPLARWIMKVAPKQFNSSELRTHEGCPPGLRDASKMQRACEALRDRGWVRYIGERNDGRPGRRSLLWEVNSSVFT